MDKLAFAGAVAAAGLAGLPRVLLEPRRAGPGTVVAGPVHRQAPLRRLVDRHRGGRGLGHRAGLAASSVHLRRGAVVEPYRPSSYDLNVAVRTWPELQLSAIERPLRSEGSSEILGYRDKYLGGEGMVSAPRELPAQIPEAMEKAIRDAAARRWPRPSARGVARIDFLADGDEWFVNEINTIPGSLAKYLWVESGRGAVRHPAHRHAGRGPASGRRADYDATGADGAALMSAGTIASKLG